ncbi:ankyrin repeat domain-containing protein [Deinococcus multiflagellatus]|uniref:Ankyrin repeat domain-containing protein n=1 Tax=Deinococcus multiflagellatus TaxID=1656887 RepID=A0ABW1ZFE5_9DEIO|nr:ankyrin repeat domain-containing protein [Deinococcus multiflagellatus]MBZ9712921.1 ankyrin repeat domain-containing protein [Deinococcus multiflagellatus]
MPTRLIHLAEHQQWDQVKHALALTRHSTEELTGALVKAVFFQNLEMTQLLLEAGANPNRSFDGAEFPPVSAAVEQAWQPGLQLLLAHGGDVNVRRFGGWTPLIHAVDVEADGAWQTGEPATLDLLRFLLEQGADPTLRDDNGECAADLARRYGWDEAVQLLSQEHLTDKP